jgi:DNA-binding CsgD family transcriptional regulator
MANNRNADLNDVLVQLKLISRIMGAQMRDKLKQNEIIALLDTTGASNQEIADMLDTTADAVRVTRGRLKKKKDGSSQE